LAARSQCQLRQGRDRVPRHERVCKCCTTGEREDELHLMQCPAYLDIRQEFSDLFAGLPWVHVWHDNDMRRFMCRGGSRREWERLADMLTQIFTRRDAILHDTVSRG